MPLAAATSLAVCPAAGALALTRLDSCCPSSVTSTVEPSAKVYVFQALPFAEVGLPFLSSVAVEPIGVPRPRLASFASRALVLAPPVVAGTVGVACGPGNAPVAVFGRDAGRGVAVGEPATGVPSALMALPWASTQVRVPSGSVPTEAPAGKGMSGHPPSDQRVLAVFGAGGVRGVVRVALALEGRCEAGTPLAPPPLLPPGAAGLVYVGFRPASAMAIVPSRFSPPCWVPSATCETPIGANWDSAAATGPALATPYGNLPVLLPAAAVCNRFSTAEMGAGWRAVTKLSRLVPVRLGVATLLLIRLMYVWYCGGNRPKCMYPPAGSCCSTMNW